MNLYCLFTSNYFLETIWDQYVGQQQQLTSSHYFPNTIYELKQYTALVKETQKQEQVNHVLVTCNRIFFALWEKWLYTRDPQATSEMLHLFMQIQLVLILGASSPN